MDHENSLRHNRKCIQLEKNTPNPRWLTISLLFSLQFSATTSFELNYKQMEYTKKIYQY